MSSNHELNAVNEELRITLAQLRSTQTELRQKNQELEIAYQTLQQERRQLQAARDELEMRVVERTAELVAANQSLQQQQDQWQALFDRVLDAIIIVDDEGNYLDANPAACELFGLPRDELLRSSVANFADPELDITQVWQQFLQQGQMLGELCLHRPDGSIRETEYAAIANFVPGHHLSILRDISDRKQTEAALKQSEWKLRAIFDSTFQFIGLLTCEGIVVEANRTALDAVAAKLPDVIGQPFWTTPWWRNFPEQQQRLQLAIVQAASGEFVRFEAKHTRADGTVAFVDFSLKPVLNDEGNIFMLILEGRDITDRKLDEQKIYEQAALLDIASDAIFVRDLSHHILYWNQGAKRLYGWLAAEVINQPVNQLLQTDTVQLSQIMRILLEQGEWRGELHKVTKTGGQVTVEARWTLVRNEAGQPKCILSVETDITEKKHMEAQFYRAQRLESLGTLASGIAHDLNNVLTPILTISQVLRLKQTNLDALSQEMLQVLEESAKQGANMLKQILTFTRGTGGERSPVQIVPLLQEVINVIQQTFPKSIGIRQTISDQLRGLVSADSTHLHQVFMNLCVNARDAMPNGGILSLSIEHCFVDQAFAQTNLDAQVGDYVVVTITDTGTGIPLDVRDRIFDPFFTTKAPGQGTGLGLAIVLRIVKDYGGFLQIFSEVGHGTQVKVYLPAIEGMPTRFDQLEEQFNGNGELVLIVDDDIAVQLGTQSLLESYHCKVLSTHDGMEAIALYAQHQDEIRLVILDIMMPNMSGISLIQRLKEINPMVKTIAMSGLPANREPALAAGANAFLPKPYTLENLLGNLQALITA